MPVWEGALAGITGIEASWTRSDYPFADARVMHSGKPWPSNMAFPRQRLEDKSVRPTLHDIEFYAYCPAFSPAIYPLVEPMIEGYGEFHPIVIEDVEFQLFNAFRSPGQSNDPLQLNLACFTHSHIFRVVRGNGTSCLCAYSALEDPAHDLITACVSRGWTGMVYREIWPNTPDELPYV